MIRTLALIPLAVIASALAGIGAGLVTGWPGAGWAVSLGCLWRFARALTEGRRP